MSIIDDPRQWFKSKLGVDINQIDREHAFCAHAIGQQDTLVINNAQDDLRFVENPLVTGPPGIRFYAGAPLQTSTGAVLGTLCVIDTVSREITPTQKANLEALARQVMAHLELRLQTSELQRVAAERDRQTAS
ncbi:MAG: GAF domain-containing protein [Gammaproteobacteria bacterium]|jgi:GAF domain-containing protein